MEVHEQDKLVEIWLTRAESHNPAFRDSLKPLFQQYKARNYLVAMFLSGEAELYPQARDLLLYNRRRLAEQDIQEGAAPAMNG